MIKTSTLRPFARRTHSSAALRAAATLARATGEGGDGALLEGTVRLEDGCFLVEASTGERFLTYFPEDEVEWSDEGLRYGGSTYGSGDSIALGGGIASDSRPVPSDCRERSETLTQWTVAQSG